MEIIDEFLLYKKLMKRSETTLINYRQIFIKFFSDVGKGLDEINYEDVQYWLDNYCENMKDITINRYLSVLNVFFKYCVSQEVIEKVPIKKRWKPRITDSLPKYLSKQDYAKVKLTAENLPLRNRTIICFLESSGARCSEVHNLNIEDIDLDVCKANVFGKGSKNRTVQFSTECSFLIQQLIEQHPTKTGALFLSYQGNRLSRRSIQIIVKKLGVKANIKGNLFPHKFRHTYATRLLSKGKSLREIGDHLGHENLNTTRIYARIPRESLRVKYSNAWGD